MQNAAHRTTVTIDDRRAVLVIARTRSPREVAHVPHEQFIRNALKDRMGWPRREQASEQLKKAAREMANHLVERDKKAASLRAANEAAAAMDMANNV